MKIVSCSNTNNFVNTLQNFNKNNIIFNSISKFEDGEMLVKIENEKDLKNEDVLVIQSISNNVNDAIIELLFTLNIVKNSMPKSVFLLITYAGYSRQDRIENLNECFSSKVLFNLLSYNFLSRVFIVDIHAPQTMGFFNVPNINILVKDFIIKYIRDNFDLKNAVLISPDIGNAKNVINIASCIGIEYGIAIKYRPKANENKIISLIGADVSEKNCIIIDDIVDSAGTLCNVANVLKQNNANIINAFITHPVLSEKSVGRIKDSSLNNLYICNTIDCSKKIKNIDNIKLLSISDWCLNEIYKFV